MNQNKDIVIIGCGAGGGTAAQFARKTGRTSTITIFEKGKYPQYSKCGLPYVLAGKIPQFTDLIEFSEEWFKKQHIDLHLETTVETIDPQRKMVIGKRNNTIVEKSYDHLIIATGAQPGIPPIQNVLSNGQLTKGIYRLRTITDAQQIAPHMKKGYRATIVGAGLIGLELADTLHKKGMKVTVVEALPTILANTLDADMADPILEEISNYITILTNNLAIKVDRTNENITAVVVKDTETGEEKPIATDLMVIATGNKPNVALAQQVGCKIGTTGGIIVNEKSETTVKNIYAVGDCTEYRDFITEKPILIGLGSLVVRQGIAAGINAAGGRYQVPEGVLQTRTSEFFGIEIAAVGPITSLLHEFSAVSGKFKGSSLPEYFPGGKSITIKVIVHGETGRIVAAQAVGSNAAQRINTFASAILSKMTVDELRKLETTYAPPIAPTLDAITLACDVAAMKLDHKKRI